MNNALGPHRCQWVRAVAGKIAAMSAESLAIDPVTAALRLLGARLVGRGGSAVIVEVEAYGGPPDGPWPDAAAHSFRGPTTRSTIMFGPAGRLYTYRSHGIHVCANVVTGPDGVASAARAAPAAPRCPRWLWPVARPICVRRWESRWTTTESTCSTPTARSESS